MPETHRQIIVNEVAWHGLRRVGALSPQHTLTRACLLRNSAELGEKTAYPSIISKISKGWDMASLPSWDEMEVGTTDEADGAHIVEQVIKTW